MKETSNGIPRQVEPDWFKNRDHQSWTSTHSQSIHGLSKYSTCI